MIFCRAFLFIIIESIANVFINNRYPMSPKREQKLY